MAVVQGYIIDDETSKGVPGATVSLADKNGKYLGIATVTDSSGRFTLSYKAMIVGNMVIATSVGYIPQSYEVHGENENVILRMAHDVKELPPVVVTSGKKMDWLLIGGISAAVFFLTTGKKGKRKVSGLFPGGALTDTLMPVILVGAVVVILKYGDNILELLGLKKPANEQQTEDAVNDPGSYWDPSFWKKGPAGTLILKGQVVSDMIMLLNLSFGTFNDDEERVIAAFKQMCSTQSQLSYFADQFQQKTGRRLADWLYKDSYPNDRLSLAEMAQINDYMNKLPQYRP